MPGVSPPVAERVLFYPVGGQDVVSGTPHDGDAERLPSVACGADHGPFPCSDQYSVIRGPNSTQHKVESRVWGQACLDVLEGVEPAERAEVVARHLAAPILSRVLDSPALPDRVDRLVFVVTRQAKQRGGFDRDDTWAFAELLALWVEGARPRMTIGSVGDPVVLTHGPHLIDEVARQFEAVVEPRLGGAPEALLCGAGGTPAMTNGVFAVLVRRAGLEVRLVQVPRDPTDPVMWSEFPAMVRRSQVVESVRHLLGRREPVAASELLHDLRTALPPAVHAPAMAQCRLALRLAGRERLAKGEIGSEVGDLREALLDHARKPYLLQMASLAAWEAMHAWSEGRHAEFLNLVSALNDALPAASFRATGDGTAPKVRGLFPEEMDWKAFPACKLARSPRVKRMRGQLADPRASTVADECLREIFRCLADKRSCTCGVGQARPPQWLRSAVAAWRRFNESSLRGLRNRSPLSHRLDPVEVDAVRAAMSKLLKAKQPTDDAVEAWLRAHLGAFGVDLGSDLVSELCARAGASLAAA